MATLTASLVVGTTDEVLVAAARAGDDRAFEQLYGRYRCSIAAYIQGRVRDHARSEDITQEVFLSALKRMRETERPIVFKPWIYEIARNACIDAFRRRTDEVPLGEHLKLVSTSPTPDVAVDARMALESLRGAMGGLSEPHRDVLVMREFEGRSYREIGKRLGMSRSSVESTLFRARRRLREEWEKVAAILPLPAFLRSHWVSVQYAEPMSAWAKAATVAATVVLAGTSTSVVTSHGDSKDAREVADRGSAPASTTTDAQGRSSSSPDKPTSINHLSRARSGTTATLASTSVRGVQSLTTAGRIGTPSEPSTGSSAKTISESAPTGSREVGKTPDTTSSATTEPDRPTTSNTSESRPTGNAGTPAPTATSEAGEDTRDGHLLARILARRREARGETAPPAVAETIPEAPVSAPSVAETTSTVTDTAPRRPVLNAISKIITGGTERPIRNEAPVDNVVDTTADTTSTVTP